MRTSTIIILLFCLSLILCCTNEKDSDIRARIIIEPRFTSPGFSEGLTLTNCDHQWGYFDQSGRCIINLREKGIDTASNFKEGFALVEKNKKWGFINKRGEFSVQPRYDNAWPFSEGLAAVERQGVWGFVNTTGVEVIPPSFVEANSFQEGFARVNIGGTVHGTFYRGNQFTGYLIRGGKKGYINKTGKMTIEADFDVITDFVNGYARVNVGGKINDKKHVEGGKWGFIDSAGHILVKPVYDETGYFEEGCVAVRVGEKWGLLNKSGKVVLEPVFGEHFYFSEGLAAVREDNAVYGYIDKQGRYIIKPEFRVAGDFVEGLAPASVDGVHFGFINEKGKWKIKPKYYEVEHFSEGFAVVHLSAGKEVNREAWGHKSKYGGRLHIEYKGSDDSAHVPLRFVGDGFTEATKKSFIDTEGKRIIREEFDDARSFKNGIAAIKINEAWGYLSVQDKSFNSLRSYDPET